MLRKLFLIAISLAAVSFAIYQYSMRSELHVPEPNIPAASAEKATAMPVPSDAIFTTLEGEPFPLSKLRGRTILLNFWASWCPPCVKEFPGLVKLTQEMKGKVALVAVSNDSSVQAAKKFLDKMPSLKEKSADIFVLFDPQGKTTTEKFAVFRFPESFVINKNYLIARKLVGEVDWLRRDLFSFFEELAQTIPFQSPHL